MFSETAKPLEEIQKLEETQKLEEIKKDDTLLKSAKYKAVINSSQMNYEQQEETNFQILNQLLETEKITNKADTWNKLDKTVKIQKLHAFSEKYGKDNSLPVKDVKGLKLFFNECMEKGKMQKAKDVVYNKDTGIITSIPSLFFNVSNRAFTLKITDSKRVSTIKSLTPKRMTESLKPTI